MHSSVHDKAQRRRGLQQRGRPSRPILLSDVTRLRTRRTLVATAALVLLVLALLALCHARLLSQRPAHRDGAHNNADTVADDSTSHVAASPTDRWLLRPDAQHGGSVRVMLLMVSTRVDEQLCYALASAYFADLPIVVLGYGTRPYVNAMKPSLYLDAMQRAGLRDRDVVLLLDSDILFSGEDMLPFIDDYIARSPAAPSALDVCAVRVGTARAPSLYTGEPHCGAVHFAASQRMCKLLYADAHTRVIQYATAHNITYDLHNTSVQPLRYLNSGVSIHRVWSARELLRAYVQYIATHKPTLQGAKGWRSDQSVFALFYNDLRAWEVEHDVLRNSSSTAAATAQRGPHGLRAGQLQLEQTGRLAAVVPDTFRGHNYLRSMLCDSCASQKSTVVRYDRVDVTAFMDRWWHRYNSSVHLQQRTLTRAGNGTHMVDLTPPLLHVASQYDDTRRWPTLLTSPLVWHVAEGKKPMRMLRLLQVLPWYGPMRYNATRWQQGRAQVLASLVELWTATMNTTQHVRYGDVCVQHHPFMARHT